MTVTVLKDSSKGTQPKVRIILTPEDDVDKAALSEFAGQETINAEHTISPATILGKDVNGSLVLVSPRKTS